MVSDKLFRVLVFATLVWLTFVMYRHVDRPAYIKPYKDTIQAQREIIGTKSKKIIVLEDSISDLKLKNAIK